MYTWSGYRDIPFLGLLLYAMITLAGNTGARPREHLLNIGRAVSPRGKMARKEFRDEKLDSAYVSYSFDEYVLLCNWISWVMSRLFFGIK